MNKYLYFLSFVFFAFQDANPERLEASNSGNIVETSVIQEVPVNSDRVKHIRFLFKKYPEIKLPFHFKTQMSQTVTDFNSEYGIDTLVFGDDAPCGIIGVIPDTTDFFGFFYLIAADDAIPAIVVFDKNGNLIEKKALSKSCWQGCESDCRSFIDIDENYKITFRFEEFWFDFKEDYSYCSEKPYEAFGFIEYSHISPTGKIIKDNVDSLTFEELMKNPILHND